MTASMSWSDDTVTTAEEEASFGTQQQRKCREKRPSGFDTKEKGTMEEESATEGHQYQEEKKKGRGAKEEEISR